MAKMGKFLAGATVLGLAAFGAYTLYKQSQKKPAPATEGADADAFDEDEEDTDEAAEDEESEEEEEDGDAGEASDDLGAFAKRTYSTIKDTTEKAAGQVRKGVTEVVGPKGGDILKTFSDAADKMGQVLADSAQKIVTIVKDPSYTTVDTETKEASAAEETVTEAPAEEAPAKEPAAEEPGAPAEEEAAPAEEPKAEEPAPEAPADADPVDEDLKAIRDAVKDEVDKAAGTVEEFFDDENKEDK